MLDDFGLGFWASFAHKDQAIALFDLPAGKRIESRRAQRLATAKIEAGMVPGTTDGAVDDQAIGQRPVIVGAMGADGEDLAIPPHQQNLVFADAAGQQATFREST